jgi:NAD(P)-dependent dehydrogenase (short-subunit alcohol dehydrogenase family)
MHGLIDMSGRVCLVTGANSGIGKATALGLAKRGATVVMVCRNRDRGEAARADIVKQSGSTTVDLYIADLASQSVIRQLADVVKVAYPRLHVLINNAGLNLSRRTLTVDGVETTFAVNHLAPFLLSQLLFDALKAAAPARIINITSGLLQPIAFDDLRRNKPYRALEVYAQSKMANVLFTYALAQRIEGSGVTVNCVTPGLVRTNLGRDLRGLFRLFLSVMRPFMQTPEQAADALLYLASSPDLDGVSGKCFAGKKETARSSAAYDVAAAEQLWHISEQLTQRTLVEA